MMFRNTARAEGKGVQFEIEKKWPVGIGGRFSYSYQEVNSNDENIRFQKFPEASCQVEYIQPVDQK